MRILVVGAGSTGGYFGGRLAEAGRDVTFLVRSGRADQLRRHGLRIISPNGNATLAPRLVSAGEIQQAFDVVLVTVKAFSLEAALADVAPAVGAGTVILPVLNGMRHMDVLAERFGRRAVVGCACKVRAAVDEQGQIVQLTKLHDLVYGEMDGNVSPRIERVDRLMQGAGFDARLSADIEREMWEKWILLAALGGINCLMRGNVGQIGATVWGAEVALRFLDETVRVVAAVGRAPGEEFLAAAKAQLTQPGSSLTSSMFRDLQNGRPVEADQIIGDLAARGRLAGIDTPLLNAAYTQLAIYQNGLNLRSI